MSANINFGSCGPKSVNIENPNLDNGSVKHYTGLFREDINWRILSKTILDTTPIKDIYVGACADGSEPITLKMQLEKDDPTRKFNITAFDISQEKIAMAKCGVMGISTKRTLMNDEPCLVRCNRHMDEVQIGRYLQKIPGSDYKANARTTDETGALFKMTEHLRENMKFMVADAIDLTKQKFQDPIVFMFRNVLPYIKESARNELAGNLAENIPKGSILAVGSYDTCIRNKDNSISRITQLLPNKYFKAISADGTIGSELIFRHL